MRLLFCLFLFLSACEDSFPSSSAVEIAPQAAFELSGPYEQGAVVFGRTHPGAQVRFNDQDLMVSSDGHFLFGFGRDYTGDSSLVVTLPSGDVVTQTFDVAQRDWDIQHIDGLEEKYVEPDPQTAARVKKDNAEISRARQRYTQQPYYLSGFMTPAQGPISGVFGSQRILNGKAKSPHSGTDIAAPEGAAVYAMADGVVSLIQDGVYTGHTVMLDHGQGLSSVYIHLSQVLVQDNQSVQKGQEIGKVGATGRATGPHLHFGMAWFGQKVDPQTVLATAFN